MHLEEKTSGVLEVSKEDLEKHIQAQYSDPARNEQLGLPGYMPKPAEPAAEFDVSPPKLSKYKASCPQGKVIISARAKWSSLQTVQELSKSTETPVDTHENCLG